MLSLFMRIWVGARARRPRYDMVSSSPVREGEENGSGISEKFRERERERERERVGVCVRERKCV
jgi:hypothetical protein